MKLTDISIRNLAVPESGQKLYYDSTLPAFGCRVSQGGTRSFFLQLGADRQFVTIGRYPIISLSQARAEAKRLLAERTLGNRAQGAARVRGMTKCLLATQLPHFLPTRLLRIRRRQRCLILLHIRGFRPT